MPAAPMPRLSSALIAAYRAAIYRIDAPAGRLDLRIGSACAALDRLLEAFGVGRAVLLTAWNPGSRPCPDSVNRRRAARLAQTLAAWRIACLPASSMAPDGGWREEGLLALGLAHGRACQLAARFRQAGFVELGIGEPPRLYLQRRGCAYRPA